MKGFKTLAAAAAITIIGSLEQIGIVELIPDKYEGLAVAGIGLLMAALRMVTNTPVTKS